MFVVAPLSKTSIRMVAICLLASISSFLVGHAPPPHASTSALMRVTSNAVRMCDAELDERSPAYRAKIAADKAAVAAARRESAAALDFSSDETEALMAVSKSLEPCWLGAPEDCPDALRSKFTGQPLDFFAVLRSPTDDPDPAVWPAVREKWPVLGERDDDALLAALQPVKDVRVDRRSL